MEKLYDLKETLCKQLEEYADKDMSAGTLEVIDKLSHSIKNLDKIIEKYEEEYSGDMYSRNGDMYSRGRNGSSYGNYGASYARRRDSMGRYSRGYSGDMMSELHELMEQAPDERTRQEFQRFIKKMEQ